MSAPRPFCFMIMPYGRKKTDAPAGQGVAEINFDVLWDKALRPAITQLGYEPVRADQDVGALIIHEMLERLYFSDVVIAEMTIPNGNVYYEVGVRHACRRSGCVLLAADWSRQLFDVAQMRTVRYPLTAIEVDDSAAQLVQRALVESIPPLVGGASPIYEVLPGFPGAVDPNRAQTMREQMQALADFQVRTAAVRNAPREQRGELIGDMLADYRAGRPMPAAVAHGLLKLFENLGAWKEILDLLTLLPPELAQQPNLVEVANLATSKLGDQEKAIAALEALIQSSGATSEREGLLGGRYKELYKAATGASKVRCLNSAITHYELGMMLDLNDYYPSSNLPRLYRARGWKGDTEKARAVAQVVYFACQRAKQRNASDKWLRPTLLGAAFDAGDVVAAEELSREIQQEGPEAWIMQTTLNDLEGSLQFVTEADKQSALREILDGLRQLL